MESMAEGMIKDLVASGHALADDMTGAPSVLVRCLAAQLEVQLVRANELAEDHQKAIESIKQADSAVKLAHEKFSALAAENARLKSAVTQQIELRAEIKKAGRPPHADFWVQSICEAEEKVKRTLEETPSTDAFLAEVRAQGVEMMRKHPSIKLCSLTHICDELAAQLRKGGNQ